MSASAKDILKLRLAGKESFSTAELRAVLLSIYPAAAEKTLSWKIFQLKEEGFLHQLGRGVYSFNQKPSFFPCISLKTKRTYNKVQDYCGAVPLVVWDTEIISKTAEESIPRHYIFLALPKDKLEETFNQLLDFSKKVFLNPNREVIARYLIPQEEAIILLPLSSETPTIQVGDFPTLSIEALLVNTWIMKEDYWSFIDFDVDHFFKIAFSKYTVNESKLLRFAARRDKRAEINNLIKSLK